MLLKRIFDHDADGKPTTVSHLEVKHTGTHAEQNFSERLVNSGVAEGWITLGGGKLTIKAEPENLVYTILRGPGHYCCHCGQPITDAALLVDREPSGARIPRGLVHVIEAHGQAKSPDPSNPSGYRKVNGYECVLDAAQHEKFKVKE